MSGVASFSLQLTGDTADYHQFQGYDGYMSLAGFAWVLSLSSHYIETGTIRQRGEFAGRDAVRGFAPQSGSVIVDFVVNLENNPQQIFALTGASASSVTLLYALVKRVLNKNFGQSSGDADEILMPLLERRGGDLEALVAISEAPIRQAHSVIGSGADNINVTGGFNIINKMNHSTKEYVKKNIVDTNEKSKSFSVSSFNVNSGYGSVFDSDLGHNIPFSVNREAVKRLSPVFSWGLDQYATGTGKKVSMKYTSILAMDGRPKRYLVKSAKIEK